MKAKAITDDVFCPSCGNTMPRPPSGSLGKCAACGAALRAPGLDEVWCSTVGEVELQAVTAGIGRGLVVGGGRIG